MQYLPKLQSKRANTWQSTRPPICLAKMKIWRHWDDRCVREGCSTLRISKNFTTLASPNGVESKHLLSCRRILIHHLTYC